MPTTQDLRPKTEGLRPKTEGLRPKTEGLGPKTEKRRPKASDRIPTTESCNTCDHCINSLYKRRIQLVVLYIGRISRLRGAGWLRGEGANGAEGRRGGRKEGRSG